MSGLQKRLEEVVLGETKDLNPKYRCHEVARIIGNKLTLLGLNVAIKDGFAAYDIYSLRKDFLQDFFEDFPDEAKRELLGERVEKNLRVFHSWCEVSENQNEIILVDWHACLKLSQDETFERVLIIKNKKNLPHSYNPVGVTLGKWIILKKFPPYFTRLRL